MKFSVSVEVEPMRGILLLTQRTSTGTPDLISHYVRLSAGLNAHRAPTFHPYRNVSVGLLPTWSYETLPGVAGYEYACKFRCTCCTWWPASLCKGSLVYYYQAVKTVFSGFR